MFLRRPFIKNVDIAVVANVVIVPTRLLIQNNLPSFFLLRLTTLGLKIRKQFESRLGILVDLILQEYILDIETCHTSFLSRLHASRLI